MTIWCQFDMKNASIFLLFGKFVMGGLSALFLLHIPVKPQDGIENENNKK